jgi:hypothetical protein
VLLQGAYAILVLFFPYHLYSLFYVFFLSSEVVSLLVLHKILFLSKQVFSESWYGINELIEL